MHLKADQNKDFGIQYAKIAQKLKKLWQINFFSDSKIGMSECGQNILSL